MVGGLSPSLVCKITFLEESVKRRGGGGGGGLTERRFILVVTALVLAMTSDQGETRVRV